MELTPREAEIFHELLAHHGIDTYVVGVVPENLFLPGGSYPGEICMKSGTIITPTSVYDYWFDWVDDHYSLGEEDGSWEEISEEVWSTGKGYNPDAIRQIQAELRASLTHDE